MSTAIGAGISGVFGEKPGSGVSAYDNIYSVHFDSPAQRINCGDSSSFSFPGTVASDRAFSISTWVYFVDTVNSVHICGKGDVGTANAEYNLDTDSSGRVRIRLYDSNVSSTSTSYWQGRNNTSLETNKWYHIVATFDGTTPNNQTNSIRIYVNNQLNNVVTRVNNFVEMFDNGGKFILGTTDGVNSKNIYMDEAAIFNRALTQADINYLYSIPFTPNLTVNGNFTELGSELILNGDFEELGDNGVDYPSDVASFTAPFELDPDTNLYTFNKSLSGSGRINFGTPIAAVVGQTYKIVIDITISSGNANVALKSGNSQTVLFNFTDLSDGVNTFYSTVTGVNGDVNRLFASSGATDNSFTLNSISVKQVDPNDRWNVVDSDANNYVEFTEGFARLKFLNTSPITKLETSTQILQANQTYKLVVDVHDVTSGEIKIDGVGIQEFFTTEGVTTRYITPTGNTPLRFYRNTANVDVTLASVSVKQVSDWTFGDGWSVNSSNQAEYDGTGTTSSALEQTVATYEAGKKYQVQFQLDGSLNGVAVSINGGTAVNALKSTTDNSSRSVTVIAGSGSNSLKITPLGATDTFTISDITSKLITSLAAPNTDRDDARAIDLTGMSDLDHWWRMGDTQGPATYPIIHDAVYNPFGEQLVENGNFDELGPQLIQNPYFNLGPEEVTNGDFANWTGDNPDNYLVLNEDANNYVTESNGQLRMVSDNSATIAIRPQPTTMLTPGNTYRVSVDLTFTTGTLNISGFDFNTSGTKVFYLTAPSTYLQLAKGSTLDVLIDNISVKEVPHWSLQEGWSIENGFAVQDGTNTSYSSIQQNSVTTSTKTYKVSIDIDEVSGPVELKGSGVYTRLDTLGVGSHVVYITADASYIRVLAFAGSKIKFKDFFVEQVDPEGEWTLGTGWSIGDGKATSDGSQTANSLLYQGGILSIGTTFKAQLTLSNHQSGTLRFVLGAGGSEISCSSNGTFTFYGNKGTDNTLYLSANSTFEGSIDNVSVQQVSDTSGIMENMNPDNIVAFSPPDPDPLVGDEFIFSVNTAYTGTGVSNADQFQLPLISAGTLDFTVIWGDGTQDIITSYNQAETLHTYPSSGTYTIGIRANTQPLKGFQFNSGGDKFKMSNIVNWGGSNFNLDQQESFFGCSNMTCTATDAPVITTTTLYRAFRGCSLFDGDLSNWDVSGVNRFSQMFRSCNAFTGKGLENWDTSSVDQIDYMFLNNPVFNGQIGGWDTSGVTNMGYTFQQCTIFNQDISSWNTSLVTQMTSMFQDAFEFNHPLNSWDVSSCVSFASMFKNAIKFNQPLNNWTIKNDAEVNMNAMFFNANRFNQDVSMWDVSRVRFMQYMFFSCADMSFGFDGWDTSSVDNFFRFADYTDVLDTSFGYLDISSAIDIGLFKDGGQTISTDNYNNTLIGWAAQTVNPNLTTSFGNATYSYSAFDARNTLTSAPNNWTITDGGYVPTDNAFQFTVNPNLQTLGNEEINIAGGTPQQAGDWANATATSVDFTGTSGGGTTYYDGIESGLTNGSTYKLTLTVSNFFGTSDLGFSGAGGVPNTARKGSNNSVTVYFVSNGTALRLFGRAGTNSGTMTVSVKEVLSDTNQFELPLINSGTQDFVVDWGDGEQDKITAWDDTAKLHSYYTYGSDLVSGGTFTTQSDVDLWTGYNDGVLSLSDGRLLVTPSSPNSGRATQGITTVPGHTYILSLDFENPDSSNVLVGFSNNANGSGATYTTSTSVSGSFNFYYTATATTTYISLSRLVNDTKPIYYDNVSVKEQTPDTTPKTISIDGTIQGWQFNAPGDYLKLNNINRWGALDIHNTAMFYRCGAMTCTATDAPTVSTTSFSSMFRNCTNFNGAIGNWDISSVESLYLAFRFCTVFNKSIDSWDVSNVTNMTQTFYECSSFDQDLNSWDTSNVVSMDRALFNCLQFNGDIYSWDTTNVENMTYMLYNCGSFDQSLAAWNIENVTNLTNLMQNATGLSTSNYNLTLVSWAHQNVNSGLEVDFGGSQYSAGGAAAASRNILTSAPNNWTISDGGSV